jgi:hypothetical protein
VLRNGLDVARWSGCVTSKPNQILLALYPTKKHLAYCPLSPAQPAPRTMICLTAKCIQINRHRQRRRRGMMRGKGPASWVTDGVMHASGAPEPPAMAGPSRGSPAAVLHNLLPPPA